MGLEQILFYTQIGATGYEAASQIQQGRQEAAAFEASSKISMYSAKQSLERMMKEIENIRQKGKIIKGEQLASAGASGVSLEGSTLEILKETAKELAKEEAWATYAGRSEAQYYRSQAKLESLMGKSRKRAATTGAITTGIRGLTTAYLYGKEKGIFDKQSSQSLGTFYPKSSNIPR